jgi:hypothetical protein
VTYRLPLSRSQRDFLVEVLTNEINNLDGLKAALEQHGNAMTTTPVQDIDRTEKVLKQAKNLKELLLILEDRVV